LPFVSPHISLELPRHGLLHDDEEVVLYCNVFPQKQFSLFNKIEINMGKVRFFSMIVTCPVILTSNCRSVKRKLFTDVLKNHLH